MNTPSHWLMTVAIGKFYKPLKNAPRWALGLGSIAPDIPLYVMSFGGIYYFRNIKGWSDKETFSHLFDYLYFHDPLWIGFHNFLHSPTMLLILAITMLAIRSKFPRFSRWSLYFLGACFLHSLVDIVTHHDDGPVLFFPFNWSYRFPSPVSYWDPKHFGGPFMFFEAALDLVLIFFLVRAWIFRKPTRSTVQ